VENFGMTLEFHPLANLFQPVEADDFMVANANVHGAREDRQRCHVRTRERRKPKRYENPWGLKGRCRPARTE
jgi:hypothetical protein